MSTWNYRVWKRHVVGDEYAYTIRDTYYNSKGGICACTEEPMTACAYDVTELQETLQRMLDVSKGDAEVLDYDNFVFERWE